MNKLQWNFIQNTEIFIHENASENIICEMAAILSRGRWVKLYLLNESRYWWTLNKLEKKWNVSS